MHERAWWCDPGPVYAVACALLLLLLAECAADGGTKLGLASFSVQKAEILDGHFLVTVQYDATTAGNPWPADPSDPYGEIEKLWHCEVKAYIYEEDEKERADTLAATADSLQGFALDCISRITKAVPSGTTSSSWKTGKIWFNESSPLSGSANLLIEVPLSMKYAARRRTSYVVFLAGLTYSAFNGVWCNIDGWGPLLVVGGGVNLTLTGPSLIDETTDVRFVLQAGGPGEQSVSDVKYTFYYKKGGGWVENKTYSVRGREGLSLTWDPYPIDLARARGDPQGDVLVLEMKVVAKGYSSVGELLATSNAHEFTVRASSPQFTISGPVSVSQETQEATFRIRDPKGQLKEVGSTHWEFSYKDRDGSWARAQTTERTGIADLTVTQTGKDPSIDGWLALAAEHAGLQGYMEMKVLAKVYSSEGKLIATSPSHAYRVIPGPGTLTLTVTGPSAIAPNDAQAAFSISVTGALAEEIDHVNWLFSYRDARGDCNLLDAVVRPDLGDLTVGEGGSPNLTTWRELALEHGVLQQGRNTMEMRVEANVYSGETKLGSTDQHAFTVQADIQIRRRVVGLPEEMAIKHVKLVFKGRSVVETSTDSEGYYDLPLAELGQVNNYTLEVHMEYFQAGRTYFSIRYGYSDAPVILKFQVRGDRVAAFNDISYGEGGESLAPILNLDHYRPYGVYTRDWVAMYVHLAEALEFYKDYLKEDMTYRIPVVVYTFLPNEVGLAYRYDEAKVGITIPVDSSSCDSARRPKNREYHELSHFAMHSIYGGRWPQAPKGELEERNHDGYVNPSTSDSFVEGFAVFMSMVIGEHYGNWVYREGPDICSTFGSLERNYEVWGAMGKHEEFAIAGLLWDLYDGQVQVDESRTKALDQIWEGALESFDCNGDGKLNAAELILAGYDGKTAWFELEDQAKEAIRPIDRDDDHELSNEEMTQDEKSSLAEADGNRDGRLDEKELAAWAKEAGDGGDADSVMREYDRDGDGRLGPEEMGALAADLGAKEIKRLDLNGDGRIQLKEIAYEMAATIAQQTSGMPDHFTFDDLKEQLSSEVKASGEVGKEIATFLKALLPKVDDDPVDLSFEEMWGVLRTYQNDMASVYEAFVARFPGMKDQIDEVFAMHGVFAESKSGNGKYDQGEAYRDSNRNGEWDQGEYFVDYPEGGFAYDPGEEIGRAANQYPEERRERRSTQYLPGHFIKTASDSERYTVTVEYYLEPDMEGYVVGYESYVTEAVGGMVYVQMPPPTYNAAVTVAPEYAATCEPLVFTSAEFYEGYADSVARGYFTEHDFRINQSLGPRPSGEGEEEDQLPGWFVDIFPFLEPLAVQIVALLPKGTRWLAPYVLLGVPLLLLVIALAAVAGRNRGRSKTEAGKDGE